MSKSWPFGLVVIVVGGLAGVAVAGRPVPGDPFVLEPRITDTESTSSTSVVASTTSASEPVATTTIPATTLAPASTSVAPTIAPTTTETPTTTPISGLLPRDQVRLVIANGDGRFQLATVTADRIRALGYTIGVGDTSYRVDETVIFYRPGFDDEALYAANDIGVPGAIILAFATDESQPITNSDADGDLIIVLGPDAPR
jgi:hypothetical protein